jgi:hypothetical protein
MPADARAEKSKPKGGHGDCAPLIMTMSISPSGASGEQGGTGCVNTD